MNIDRVSRSVYCSEILRHLLILLTQALKHDERLQAAPAGSVTTPKTKPDIGGKIVKPTGSIETVKPKAAPSKPQPAGQTPIANASKTGAKPHTGGSKPWETKADNQPNGDMAVAKQLQQQFTKAKVSVPKHGAKGNGKGDAYVPPHQRGRK